MGSLEHVLPLRSELRLAVSVGRLHIVAIAAGAALTFGWALTGAYLWGVAALVALDWFLVNLLNRAVDLPEDRANGIPGVDFAARHRRAIVLSGLGTLLASLLAVHLWAPALTPLRLLGHFLGLAYNWPLLPGGRRLKQLYFWKNTASATGFLVTTLGYPLAAGPGLAPDLSWPGIALFGAFFFLFELAFEVIYDLRDLRGDALRGVRTYPAVHGSRWAEGLVRVLLLASTSLLAAGWLWGLVPWRLAVMGAAPLILLAYSWRLRGRRVEERHCRAITWGGAGLFAVYHLWQWAGLPGAWRP